MTTSTDQTAAPVAPPTASDRPRRARFGLRFLISYLLRYGFLPWAVALQAGVEIAVLFQRGAQWRGDLVWTIDWIPVALIVVGPVLAGCAAIDMARFSVGTAHLFRNTLARTPAFAVTIGYATCVAGVHLLVTVGALVASRPPVGDRAAVLAVLVQLAILAFFVVIGTTVGRFVPPVLAGVTAALGGLAAVYLVSSPGSGITLLEYGGATVPRVGYAYDAGFLACQLLMILLACAALLVLRPLDGARSRRVGRRDTLTAIALGLAVVAVSVAGPDDRLRPVETTADHCGAVQAVETCFYPQHSRIAEAFQDQFWMLVSAARENGYDALIPSRVVEASMTSLPQDVDPRVGTFYVQPDHLQGATPTSWEIVSGLVQPLHCDQVQGDEPPSDQYWEDLDSLTATWVELAEPGAAEEMGYFGELLPPQEAATLVEGFRTCTYDKF